MQTSLNKYLDRPALDETVVNIRQIVEGLEEEMQNLPYARPDGLYPDMTVGAVIGADETAQWATRESTGSGTATVRSVQGATEVKDGELVPVRIAGMQSSGFNHFKLDGRTNTIFPSYPASDKRAMSESNIFQGITMNNIGGASTVSFSAVGNGYTVTSTSSGYGLGLPVSVSPSTAYHVQCNSTGTIGIGCYTADGTYIRYYGGSSNSVDFTTPDNCHWIMVVLRPTINTPTTYENICVNVSSPRNGEYEPYRIVDAIEWTTQTLRAAGSVRDELTAGELVTRVGAVDLGTLDWSEVSTAVSGKYLMHSENLRAQIKSPSADSAIANISCAAYDTIAVTSVYATNRGVSVNTMGTICVYDPNYDTSSSAVEFKTAMSGVYLYYELATPTTQPISPALPMTYRVEQGGAEAIIVPDGEIRAAPVLTVAEPVNAGDEFARIWAAIQSLGYTRNTAQLSRQISLTDVGSVDEVQKDTTDVAYIETTKEVQE